MLAKLFAFLILALPLAAQTATNPPSANLIFPAGPAGVTGYNVRRFTGPCTASLTLAQFGAPLNSAPLTAPLYTDLAVTRGTTYCYAPTQLSTGGESALGVLYQATIPPLPIVSTNPAPPPPVSGGSISTQ